MNDHHYARDAALKILARRNHSIREMKAKLAKKGVSREGIEDTVEWLTQKRLLDDHVFAQQRAESIFRTKLCGPQYVKNKLREAGIDANLIEDVIYELASDNDWADRAKKALEQWQRIHPKHKDDKTRHARFLASRGFTFL